MAENIYDKYTLAGLETAKGLLGKTAAAYPSYTPKQAISPAAQSYYQYTPTAPMSQLQAPDYSVKAQPATNWNQWQPQQGLLAGDYEKLQSSIAAPGLAAAQKAYEQGTINLADVMGGRGLYGSSQMQNQQREALDRTYMQQVADTNSNAAVQRYGMENTNINAMNGLMATQNVQQNAYNQSNRAQDITLEDNANKFALQNYQLDQTQAKNMAALNFANNQDLNTYNANKSAYDLAAQQKQIDWQNANTQEQFLYEQAKNAYNNQTDLDAYNRALSLAGYGNTTSAAANNYAQAQQQLNAQANAAQQANSTAQTGNYLGAAGLIGKEVLASDWFKNWLASS